MKLKTQAQAGTLESGDVMVLIKSLEKGKGRIIAIDSNVKIQYGSSIEDLINQMLDKFGIDDVQLHLNDKGALTPVINARLETAITRAMDISKGTLKY